MSAQEMLEGMEKTEAGAHALLRRVESVEEVARGFEDLPFEKQVEIYTHFLTGPTVAPIIQSADFLSIIADQAPELLRRFGVEQQFPGARISLMKAAIVDASERIRILFGRARAWYDGLSEEQKSTVPHY